MERIHSSETRVFRTFALGLVVFFVLSAEGLGYYQAEKGRWLSRDPIEERGGMHLFLYCLNAPTISIDFLGMWNSSVHNDKSYELSRTEFIDSYAIEIASSDNEVDNGATGPLPYPLSRNGEQDRHMKYLKEGKDSRDWWYETEYATAQKYLKLADRLNHKTACDYAASAFGRGLHSLQDKSAHRGWPGGGDWNAFKAHPAWWDDWHGQEIAGNKIHDDYWHSKFGYGVYDKWIKSPTQMASQNMARKRVESDSRKAISQFAKEVRNACICKRIMLINQ